MKKVKLFFGLISSLVLLGTAMPAYAQVSNSISGGRASDYQSATNNPQGSVGTGFQSTGSGLQPTPGQTNFAQENLSGSSDLRVAGSDKANPNTTTIAPYKDTRPTNILWPILYGLIGLATLGLMVYVVRQPDDPRAAARAARLAAAKAETEPKVELTPELQKAQQPKKKPVKKKPAKKRKK